jgi:hypothetical protein
MMVVAWVVKRSRGVQKRIEALSGSLNSSSGNLYGEHNIS